MSAFDKPRCGARRPGWERPDAGPFDRMPCVLAQEHESDGEPLHRDALAQRWFGSDTLVSALGVALAAEYLRALFGKGVCPPMSTDGCPHPRTEKRGNETICARCRKVLYRRSGS